MMMSQTRRGVRIDHFRNEKRTGTKCAKLINLNNEPWYKKEHITCILIMVSKFSEILAHQKLNDELSQKNSIDLLFLISLIFKHVLYLCLPKLSETCLP